SITETGTITTGQWTGTAIVDAYVANDLTISGGTVDNTVIGGSTKAAGSFTTLNANGTVSLDGSANELRFYEGSNYVGFEASSSLSGDQIWVLPTADGNASQVLSTNGNGALSWATASSSTMTITDNENTSENNALVFTSGGNVSGGTFGLESDGDATYNPSTGVITATGFSGSLTGTLQTAAQGNVTSLGTLTTLTVDNITTNGTNIGHTDDLDLIALASNSVTFTGTTVIPTADVNGGNIDGAAIGASSPSTAIFTSADITGSSGVILENDETITNSVDGTILINGEVSSGTGSASGVFKSNGNQDVKLETGNGNTGSITITDGSNQNISIAPNGSGSVVVTTKLDITGADGLILENDETITNSNNGTIDITAGVTKLSGDLHVIDDEEIIFGTNSDVKVQYDEDGKDALEIMANVEGGDLQITLKADEGDDASDMWQIKVADGGGVLSFGNDIASKNTFVDHLTITPHATATSSEVIVTGQLGYKSKIASAGNTTLTAAQSGSVIMQSTNTATITLPATVAGLRYTIVWTGTAGQTFNISPNSSDKIIGSIVDVADGNIVTASNSGAGTDDKDLQLDGGSQIGDRVTLVADGVDGWIIVEAVGSWTFQS
ncbi:hypothetical protein OA955_01535, partial [Candidatus Marinimicrobia bacterium]|nr:hypothetical protein [Candidatus Neomarinimicrobiota bacterium]